MVEFSRIGRLSRHFDPFSNVGAYINSDLPSENDALSDCDSGGQSVEDPIAELFRIETEMNFQRHYSSKFHGIPPFFPYRKPTGQRSYSQGRS